MFGCFTSRKSLLPKGGLEATGDHAHTRSDTLDTIIRGALSCGDGVVDLHSSGADAVRHVDGRVSESHRALDGETQLSAARGERRLFLTALHGTHLFWLAHH